jgi:hypothetical protein
MADFGGIMKIAALCIAALLATAGSASAQYYNSNRGSSFGSGNGYGTGSNPSSHYVAPHVNQNGSYTSGYYQTNPNNATLDNYGTRGNVNPYTGQTGRRKGW